MTLESRVVHPEVLIISQGAPGVAKDANSIMLERLLVEFPKGSYVVLASSRNWQDGRVPRGQSSMTYWCFRNSLRSEGSQRGQHEAPLRNPSHAEKWKLLVPRGVRRWLRGILDCVPRVLQSVFLDPLALIVQIQSAAAEAVALARSEGILSILSVSDYGPCFIAGWMAHRRTGVPLDLFVFDLWRGNAFPWSQRLVATVFERHVFSASRRVFSSSEGVSEYLATRLGMKSVVIHNSVPVRGTTLVGSHPVSGMPTVILYTGGIYWAQLDAILDMIAAIRDMVSVEFHVYSHQSREQLVDLGVTGSNVVLHGGLPQDEVRQRQAAADVLYLPLSFGSKGRHIIETAQPAKSVEYMASGVPVLVHAPPYAFVARCAREHDIAVVVDQPGPNELKRVLMALISDRTDAQRKAARAAELARSSYNSHEISHLLQSYLLHERA